MAKSNKYRPRPKLIFDLPTSLQLFTVDEVTIILAPDVNWVNKWISEEIGQSISVMAFNQSNLIDCTDRNIKGLFRLGFDWLKYALKKNLDFEPYFRFHPIISLSMHGREIENLLLPQVAEPKTPWSMDVSGVY